MPLHVDENKEKITNITKNGICYLIPLYWYRIINCLQSNFSITTQSQTCFCQNWIKNLAQVHEDDLKLTTTFQKSIVPNFSGLQ